jgi:2-polyprenyl-3-methyl-5-hydroxy-6-metoxy-1,4-benzoquinol methylase
LLDIGFGGGDLPLALYNRAQKEGYKLQITAIDTDPRALAFVKQHREIPAGISFRCIDTHQLLAEQARFDFVISNHVIHHLSQEQLTRLADQSERLCRRQVIFNDLQRSYSAYLLFSCLVAPFFRHSYAGSDGRLSIRRSYTQSELTAALPARWTVHRKFPFRLIAQYSHA